MSAGAAAPRKAPDRGGRRWELEAGAELGPWRILEPLGAGGMGEVYVAEHSWLPTRRAAVKVLQVERLGASGFADRFRAEAALLASIDHPNVVRLYDAQITEDGRAWMAMELLSGKALNEILREQRRTDIPDTLQILGDVADGAHAAHLVGIVHRDLKPGNIFITAKHVAKVLDFGTSKLLERRLTLRRLAPSTEQNVVLGTIPFMSPEQLLGNALDHRSDIYALGVIAYQMLTGQHPFVRADEHCGAEQFGYRALFTEPTAIDTYLQGCPMELWLLIRSMLGRKREDRPSSMAKVAEKMRALRGEYLAERGLPIASLGSLLGLGPAPDVTPVPDAARAPGSAPRQSAPPAPPSVPSAPLDAGGAPVPYAAALATDVVSPLCEAELAATERSPGWGAEPPRPVAFDAAERFLSRRSEPPAAWARANLRELQSTVRMGAEEVAAELAARRGPIASPPPAAARAPRAPEPGAGPAGVPGGAAEPTPDGAGQPARSPLDGWLERKGLSRRAVSIVVVVLLALALVGFGGLLRRLLDPSQAPAPPASSRALRASAPSGVEVPAGGASATSTSSSPAAASAPPAADVAASESGAAAQASGSDAASLQRGASASSGGAGRGGESGTVAGGTSPRNSPSGRPSAYPSTTRAPAPTPVPTRAPTPVPTSGRVILDE